MKNTRRSQTPGRFTLQIALFTTLMALVCLPAAGRGSEAIDELIASGRRLANDGEYRKAAEMFKQALALARDDLNRSFDQAAADHTRILVCDLRWSLAQQGEVTSPKDGKEARSGPEEQPPVATAHVVGKDVMAPIKIQTPQPQYTKEARKNKTKGVVIIQAIIDREGCVGHVKPLKELGDGLTESALAAVSRWVFRPATLNGNPVDAYYNVTINFRPGKRRD